MQGRRISERFRSGGSGLKEAESGGKGKQQRGGGETPLLGLRHLGSIAEEVCITESEDIRSSEWITSCTLSPSYRGAIAMEVRKLQALDIPELSTSGRGAAWHGGLQKWKRYLEEQGDSRRVVLVAKDEAELVGYGSLLWKSAYPRFLAAAIPEVNDLVVAEGSRRRGVGTKLLHGLERVAFSAGHAQIGIGVGLYQDYGPAQRLYVRLGYLPDGHGVTYQNAVVTGGATVRADDGLVLWLIKSLTADLDTPVTQGGQFLSQGDQLGSPGHC
jgi:GNAT superfamily N-acetyltransferase